MPKTNNAALLAFLNKEYSRLHTAFEEGFWTSYMGDHSVDAAKDEALRARDAFRSDPELKRQADEAWKAAKGKEKERLAHWCHFFSLYQTPHHLQDLKEKINALETAIQKKRGTRKEGYVNPETGKFTKASEIKMRMLVRTSPDEKIRKACFDAMQDLAKGLLPEYVRLVKLSNEYARALGYADFYDYTSQLEEGMTKKELFAIFDDVYAKTKYGFADMKKLARKMPGLSKPWNFGFMLAGDFTLEEDPYFQFRDALPRWGESFAALGIDYRGGELQLDLLDRDGKYNNGFCHWPRLVSYAGNRRVPGSSNFTCNVVNGQVGSGIVGLNTLFHEGGHAAHMLNVDQRDVVLHHEYAPMSTAWAETQSMFLDTMMDSVEWKTRYAKNADGAHYPFDLYRRKLEKLAPLRPLGMMGIMSVMYFEKAIYEHKNLTEDAVLAIARKTYKKFNAYFAVDSLSLLNIPHIYAWESRCSYHGYGLAELALSQWRRYFYEKYGHIVDNRRVGAEMARVWQYGAAKTFPQLVKLATGKPLSAKAFVADATATVPASLRRAKSRIARLAKVPRHKGKIDLGATIRMVHGKETICDNARGFAAMAEKYAKWLDKGK